MVTSPRNTFMFVFFVVPSTWQNEHGSRPAAGLQSPLPSGLLLGSLQRGMSSHPCSCCLNILMILSIPDFNDLLALISSLFASWFTYGISGIFWLFMNKGRYFSSPIKIFLTMVNIGLFLLGLSICGIGLYSSGYSIKISDSKNSWACQSSSSS